MVRSFEFLQSISTLGSSFLKSLVGVVTLKKQFPRLERCGESFRELLEEPKCCMAKLQLYKPLVVPVLECAYLYGAHTPRKIRKSLRVSSHSSIPTLSIPTLSIPIWSTSHFVNSHFVLSHLVNIDKLGIDKVGIDKVGS